MLLSFTRTSISKNSSRVPPQIYHLQKTSFQSNPKPNKKPQKRSHIWNKPTKPTSKTTKIESLPVVYTRNTVHKISSILRTSTWDSAMSQLNALPIKWDSHIICKVLKTHPPMEKAWLFFLWASRLERFKHDHFTYTTMIDIFGEAGRIESMKCLVKEMEAKGVRIDVATYTAVMNWLGKGGDCGGAVGVWLEMRRKGVRQNVVSYTTFMKMMFDHGKPREAAATYREMLKVGIPPSCHTYTVLMEHLAGAGKFKAALDIMVEMQEAGVHPDKATCNILVQKCSTAGETSALVRILEYMKVHRLVLRRPVFLEALEAFKASGESDDLLRAVNTHLAYEGIRDETSDLEILVSDISTCMDKDIIFNLLARRNFIGIEHLLDGMISKNTRLDSMLLSEVIQASCMNNETSAALMAFNICKTMGKKPDRAACTSLIGLLIRMNSFQVIIDVVKEIVKSDINLGPHLTSLLILKLGHAGMSAAAKWIFCSLPHEQNTTTYTAMMDVYFEAQDDSAALELYSEMRRRKIPASCGTFEALIAGLEGAGRIQEAEAQRKEKKRLHFSYHTRERVSMEENLCDCLFGGC